MLRNDDAFDDVMHKIGMVIEELEGEKISFLKVTAKLFLVVSIL